MPGQRSLRLRAAGGWLTRRGRELAEDVVARHRVTALGVPPRRLRARTGAPGIEEFADGGRAAAAELEAALGEGGFQRFQSILDFGCGSARVLPHVAARAGRAGAHVRCAGCDVDAEAIAWAASAWPAFDFTVSAALPPLPHPDESFDLVYSISVLSHLDEKHQDAWLAELRRVLVPGGVALLSTHGPSAFDQFRSGEVRTSWSDASMFARGPLADDEIAFVPYVSTVWNRGDLQGVGDGYGLAFHGEQYVRQHWSRFLAVERLLPRAVTGWQDLVVCVRGT